MIRKLNKNWKVSDYLGIPLFKKNILQRTFGAQIALAAVTLSMVAIPSHAFDYSQTQGNAGAPVSQEVVMTTSSRYLFPLASTLGTSQGFRGIHPGVDLRAPKGTMVVSMDDGVVVEVEYMRVGYGHFVRVAHAGTVSSLYAHLDKVSVKPGQSVTRGQDLGTVGMTGWSTGPHLHFEVHAGDRAVNPLGYIPANQQVSESANRRVSLSVSQ